MLIVIETNHELLYLICHKIFIEDNLREIYSSIRTIFMSFCISVGVKYM